MRHRRANETKRDVYRLHPLHPHDFRALFGSPHGSTATPSTPRFPSGHRRVLQVAGHGDGPARCSRSQVVRQRCLREHRTEPLSGCCPPPAAIGPIHPLLGRRRDGDKTTLKLQPFRRIRSRGGTLLARGHRPPAICPRTTNHWPPAASHRPAALAPGQARSSCHRHTIHPPISQMNQSARPKGTWMTQVRLGPEDKLEPEASLLANTRAASGGSGRTDRAVHRSGSPCQRCLAARRCKLLCT